MHGADSVGIATTMSENDYRILAKALKTPVADLTTAILAANSTVLSNIHRTLPPEAGLVEIFQLLIDVGTCEAPFALTDYSKLQDAAVIVDSQCPRMSIATRSILVQCPVPWTMPEATEMFEKMLQAYASGERVDPEAIFERAGLMLVLEDVAAAQDEYANGKAEPENQDEDGNGAVLTVREASTRLEALELLHKMACAYIWMSYRFPVAFFMRERAEEIKLAAEVGILFCLEMLQTDRAKAMNSRLMKATMEAAAYEKKRNANLVATAEIIPPEVLI
jgi:ATP-dependent RNA helicase SUPV3L1/SUV3